MTNANREPDKPMAHLTAEAVEFEDWAQRFEPVPVEDPHSCVHTARMTKLLETMRAHIKTPS